MSEIDAKVEIFYWDKEKNELHEHPLSKFEETNVTIHTIKEDSKGNIWIGNRKALLQIQKNKQNEYKIVRKLWENVTCVMEDREGMLWFSTYGYGLFVIPNLDIFSYNKSNSILPFDLVNNITQDSSFFYISNRNNPNIYRYNHLNNTINLHYTIPENDNLSFIVGFNPYKNKLYVSGFDYPDLIKKINKDNIIEATSGFSAIPTEFGYLKQGWNKIYLDPINPKLMAAFEKQIISLEKGDNIGVLPKRIRASDYVFDAKKKRVWVAHFGDLTCYENNHAISLKFQGKKIDSPSISFSNDSAVVGSRKSNLLILKDTNVVKSIGYEDGLLDGSIKHIAFKNGTAWVAHTKGVQAYNIKTGKFRNFTRTNGLNARDVRLVTTSFGKVLVGTAKELLVFDDSLELKNLANPNIVIKRINTIDTILTHGNFDMYYGSDNILQIGFQGLTMRSRGDFSYLCRLVGKDTVWKSLSADENFAVYASLPIGKYRFEVKCINGEGVMSEAATVNILIKRDWKIVLPYMVAAILILSTIFGIFYKSKQTENQLALKNSQIESELHASKLTTLKVQMNPHFIFNALASIQEYILYNEKKKANDYLSKFAELMRYTLDMSQMPSVSLDNELNLLHLYIEMEALRLRDDFSYSIKIDENIDPTKIQVPSMLIQPFVENVFKHGFLHVLDNRHKILTMKFQLLQSDTLHCIIQDNGIGRTASKVHQARYGKKNNSFAVSATQKRIQLLNHHRKNNEIGVKYTDLKNEDNTAAGTLVEITIPLTS